ncbi:hypothetical protein [Acinetobacter stercoris]|uniref:Uncharacterized protein n=1 Tax=Acinetobacter stercoris TaxID=2126983 RepID=A0A2U3MXY7_9GAMM|nr:MULTISPECIES: hypothetical protein [Acinetobacter]SPL70234.1 hypothetical protein KPC_1412 [Acinetobacter stercoris]
MFKPFEKGDESSSIYDLTLENQLDRINIYGNLQITKDQQGLKTAEALQVFINDVVKALQSEANLPERIQQQNIKEIENPFL